MGRSVEEWRDGVGEGGGSVETQGEERQSDETEWRGRERALLAWGASTVAGDRVRGRKRGVPPLIIITIITLLLCSSSSPTSSSAAAASSSSLAPRSSHRTSPPTSADMSKRLVSVDYEVFGRVQGVCFRSYTEEQARKLGLVGWVKNTPAGTVVGQVQGPDDKLQAMKRWLSNVGSPSCHIKRADFSNERELTAQDFKNFTTRY